MHDASTPTRPPRPRGPSPAAGLRHLGPAALGLVLALFASGCGGDEPPAPEPPASAPAETPTAVPVPAAGAEPGQAAASGTSAPAGDGRKRFDVPVAVTAAAADTPADALATLRGVARLSGPVPKRQKIAMDHIAGCRDHEPPLTEAVIASEEGLLQNVVVYVVRGFDRSAVGPPPAEPVELVQEGCVFRPHIAVVRAGQTLSIHNGDQTNHNVNARPAHGSNAAFNTMQPPGAEDLEQVFSRAEVAIPIGCDVHPWMKAWVAVVDSPYYAVSDETGAWSIELPPGDYLVEAWQERYGTLKGSAQVGPGEVAEFDFGYQSGKQRDK